MAEIHIRDGDDGELEQNRAKDARANAGEPNGSGSTRHSAMGSGGDGRGDSEHSLDDGERAPEPIDWTQTSKLADEISRKFDFCDESDQTQPSLPEVESSESATWPHGLRKAWPPSPTPDPFVASADALKTPLDEEEEEEVPFEESTKAGVMHGDQVERTEFEKMQLEIEHLIKELDESKRIIKENFELAQRSQAELMNFKRRTKQETDNFRKLAIDGLLCDLLPVLDSLEKAVWSIPTDDDSPIVDGVRRTLQLFISTLAKYKVEVVNAESVPFDPDIHSPLFIEETEEYGENTVIGVYQSGYLLADRLIRPATVKVSKKPEVKTEEAIGAEGAESTVAEGCDSDGEPLSMAESSVEE